MKKSKEKGAELYKNGDYEGASIAYSAAIDMAELDDKDIHVFYSNRCACYLHLNKLQQALNDAESCVRLKPIWAKGHSRKAACLQRLNRINDAIYTYERALELDPSNLEVRQALSKLTNSTQNSGRSGSGFNFANGNQVFSTLKRCTMNLVGRAWAWWYSLSENSKNMVMIFAAGLVAYYFFFSTPHHSYNNAYGYGYSDYYYGGGGRGLSWTMWGAIMLAAYQLPPMFPEMLGPYARPFFGMSWTTFMWLINLVSRGGGSMLGRRRRYY